MPIDDPLGMPPLDLGETMGPQAPPPSSPRAQAKQYAPLLALLPIVAAKGGRAGVAALLHGFQRSRDQQREYGRQDQLDAERRAQVQSNEQYRRDALAQAEANNQAQRRQQVLTQFQGGLENLDNEDAVRAYLQLYGPQARAVGLRPEALEGFAMEAVKPSQLQKKEAEKVLADAKKQYGEQAANNIYALKDGTQADWSELNRRAGVALGAPVTKVDKPTPGSFEEYVGLPPEQQRVREQQRKAFLQSDDRPPAPTGADKPLTSNQRANVINTRRNQWTRFTKSVIDRQSSVAKIDSGLAALKAGNRNAATQTIIMSFNKLLDEASVVREGEYARSEDLVPLINRIQGALERMVYGGASMKDSDLVGLANEAKNIAKSLSVVSNTAASSLRQSIEEELGDYAIPTSRVFGNSTIGTSQTTTPTDTDTGGGWTESGIPGFKVRKKQ